MTAEGLFSCRMHRKPKPKRGSGGTRPTGTILIKRRNTHVVTVVVVLVVVALAVVVVGTKRMKKTAIARVFGGIIAFTVTARVEPDVRSQTCEIKQHLELPVNAHS